MADDERALIESAIAAIEQSYHRDKGKTIQILSELRIKDWMKQSTVDTDIAEKILRDFGQDAVFQKQNQNLDVFIQPDSHQNITKTELYRMLSAFYEEVFMPLDLLQDIAAGNLLRLSEEKISKIIKDNDMALAANANPDLLIENKIKPDIIKALQDVMAYDHSNYDLMHYPFFQEIQPCYVQNKHVLLDLLRKMKDANLLNSVGFIVSDISKNYKQNDTEIKRFFFEESCNDCLKKAVKHPAKHN